MLLTTATVWATDLTDFLPVSSSGTATGYFAFSNHFYRVDWSGINTYINNDAPASFNAEAADVNKDGTIDIGDVTGVINTINNKQ